MTFSRARVLHIVLNHVSCFILFRNPFVDAVFRVKHDVSPCFTEFFGIFDRFWNKKDDNLLRLLRLRISLNKVFHI